MQQEYYIISGSQHEGPFDLVLMTRKIRNGHVTASTLIQTSINGDALAAQEIPALREILHSENDENTTPDPSIHATYDTALISLCTTSWQIISKYPETALVTTIAIFISIMVTMVSVILSDIISLFLSPIIFYTTLPIACFMLMRKLHGRTIEPALLPSYIAQHYSFSIIFGAITGIASSSVFLMLAIYVQPYFIFLILIPGSIVILLTLFAPMIRFDNPDKSAKDCLYESVALVKSLSSEAITNLFIMLVIHLSFAMMLVPLFLTTPIFYIAAISVYEQYRR